MGKTKKPAKAQAAGQRTECSLCRITRPGAKHICTACATRIGRITMSKEDKFNVALMSLIRNTMVHHRIKLIKNLSELFESLKMAKSDQISKQSKSIILNLLTALLSKL